MENLENDEGFCAMIDDFFNEVDFTYKSANPIQNIDIQKYNFSLLNNNQLHNDQIKPFFLSQTKQISFLLQSAETNIKNEFNPKKTNCETQIDIEPKFDFLELDDLYKKEVETCQINNENKNKDNYENLINKKNEKPSSPSINEFAKNLESLTITDFSNVFTPAINKIIPNLPAELQNKLINNMFNQLHQ